MGNGKSKTIWGALSVGDKTEIILLILNILPKYDPSKPKTVILTKYYDFVDTKPTLREMIDTIERVESGHIKFPYFIMSIILNAGLISEQVLTLFGFDSELKFIPEIGATLIPASESLKQKYINFYLPQKDSVDRELNKNFLATQFIEFISEIFPDTNFILI